MVGDAEFVDGGTISGYRRSAFRWTTTGGFTDLGGLEALFQSLATAISADGSVVAGQAAVTNGSRAFRWTQSGGMVAIGPLSGHAAAAATGVSADGRIVVGVSAPSLLTRNNLGFNYDADTRAFRWTAATGIQDLRQLLIADGADLTGINLVAVTAISADGQWIAGLATTPSSGTSLVAFLAQYCDASVVGTCLAPPVASGPAATLSATSSNAGNVTRGLTQAAAAITLTNSGDSSLTLSGLNISGTDSSEFTVAHDCGPLPATLAPSASCTLTPSFAPTSAGAKSAALTLATDVSGTQPSIALAGVGADFSLSATNAVASVAAGQSATLPLSLTTSGAALTRAVTFGSSGAPQGVTVSFSPASLEAGAASGSITATITTTSRVLAANLRGSDILHASGLIPALFALLLVTGYRQRSRVLGTLVVLLMIGALSSCGSGGGGGGGGSNTPPAANPNGTPAGNYTITINAAGGGVTRSTTVTLTVT